jgi:hypothetical protein
MALLGKEPFIKAMFEDFTGAGHPSRAPVTESAEY